MMYWKMYINLLIFLCTCIYTLYSIILLQIVNQHTDMQIRQCCEFKWGMSMNAYEEVLILMLVILILILMLLNLNENYADTDLCPCAVSVCWTAVLDKLSKKKHIEANVKERPQTPLVPSEETCTRVLCNKHIYTIYYFKPTNFNCT